MGRPAKDIDAELVRKLAKNGCTQDEIADFFGVTQSVISERFRSDFHLGRAESRISLRRMQFKRAMQGSDRMLIHLGKVYLGQTDRLDVTSQSARTVVYIEKAYNPRDAELDGWAQQRVRALNDRLARENSAESTTLHFEDNGFGNAPDCLIVLPAKEDGIGDG
jgi:transcriptional regulator with XRE-family HTH domain